MKGFALALATAALVGALGLLPAFARADQTFSTISTGPQPAPHPTATYLNYDYSNLIYPYWPICRGGLTGWNPGWRCRPYRPFPPHRRPPTAPKVVRPPR